MLEAKAAAAITKVTAESINIPATHPLRRLTSQAPNALTTA
jgi:hypothetical protein